MNDAQFAPKPRVYGDNSISREIYNYLLTRTEQGATQLALYQGLKKRGYKFTRRQIDRALTKGQQRGYFMLAGKKKVNNNMRNFYRVSTWDEYISIRNGSGLKTEKPSELTTDERLADDTPTFSDDSLAPAPHIKASYTYAIYETLRALGKPSSTEEIRKLLPAALPPRKPKTPTRKHLKTLLYQARHNGYVDHDDNMKYFIASRDFFEEKFNHRQELNKKSREQREQQQDTVIKPSAANLAAGTPSPEVDGGRAIIVPEATVQAWTFMKVLVVGVVGGAIGTLAVIGATTLFVG